MAEDDADEFDDVDDVDDDEGEGSEPEVTIEICGLSLYTHHGVTAAEREVGQRLLLDLRLDVGECDATLTDRIEDTIDYGQVCEVATLVAQQRSYKTLERLCAAIADRLLAQYGAQAVWVKAAKPEPPIALPVTEVSVEVWREAATASERRRRDRRRRAPRLPGPGFQHRRHAGPSAGGGRGAARARRHRAGVILDAYETEPVGLILDQADFLNACLAVETALGPEELLDVCKAVERDGRSRRGRSASRAAGDRRRPAAAGRSRLPLGATDAAPRRGQLAAVRARAAAGAGARAGAAVRRTAGREARRAARRPGGTPRRPAIGVMAPMLLVVDVGNTQTHFGVYPDGSDTVSEHWRFATVRESTRDELGAALSNLLALRGLGFADIDRSIVSSTVPQLSEEWTEMADRYLGHEMLVVGTAIRTGMPIRMDNPREVGADRLVNSVAAYDRIGGACIVVDFGTAITYDVVSALGEYLGGIITPGAEISIDALYERAAKLPKVELAPPRSLIGKSTVEAIRSGIIFGFAGQVDGIVMRLREELGPTRRCWPPAGWHACSCPRCGPRSMTSTTC